MASVAVAMRRANKQLTTADPRTQTAFDLHSLHALYGQRRRSLWSIELAHILSNMGIKKCIYATTCLGVNQKCTRDLEFYADSAEEELAEVESLFQVG